MISPGRRCSRRIIRAHCLRFRCKRLTDVSASTRSSLSCRSPVSCFSTILAMRRMLLTEATWLFSVALDLATPTRLTSLRNLRAKSFHYFPFHVLTGKEVSCLRAAKVKPVRDEKSACSVDSGRLLTQARPVPVDRELPRRSCHGGRSNGATDSILTSTTANHLILPIFARSIGST
jgi:hypothetical protein